MKPGRPLEIAIIGMACRFPGARDLVAFWENLLAGRENISDVPPDRWDSSTFFDPTSRSNDRVYSKRGGYLGDPIDFDPARHGVLPDVVAGGEPEQFLVLDATRNALIDAGYPEGRPQTKRVDVIIGKGNYFNRGNLTRLQHGRIVAQTIKLLRSIHPDWPETTFDAVRADLKASLPPFEPSTITGQLTNATAGRVANRLDLHGASFVVDAASASSLVALELGAKSLREKRCDLALVGGVYLGVDVDFPMVFCQLGALSRLGQARPFAADADGTLPGEGVGVVVLKRLQDAERDHDRIYAVLQGVGVSSDGSRTGLATPNARGHLRAIRRAYRRAGIAPESVGLIEGHGLGVPASDRAELKALHASFPPPQSGRRALGSLSGTIGHAMPAAGVAAVIKAALSLHNRTLLPEFASKNPHPWIERAGVFELNPTPRPWIHGDRQNPRRAGVNAFGFAGVSAHAILEEHSPSADESKSGFSLNWDSEAILLGASDQVAWSEKARRLVSWLEQSGNRDVSLKDLAATINAESAGSDAFRVGLVVKSASDLKERLIAAQSKVADPRCESLRDTRGTYFWRGLGTTDGSLAFLFPGEGSQYPRMLADLCLHFPEVRALFDTADRLALERNYARLPSEVTFGNQSEGGEGEIWSVGMATNLVLSSQWALYQLLSNLGLRPTAVAGHSSGEFLALAAAGALSVDRQLETSLGDLGRVFESLEAEGQVPTACLAAIAAPREKIEPLLKELAPSVAVAIDNCPHQVVVAGDRAEVDAVLAQLRQAGVLCEILPFDRAYHTRAFERTLGPIRQFFEQLPLVPPRITIYSCATHAPMKRDPESIRQVAIDQWTLPVEFRSTIETMYDDGIRTFVEVGARGSLTGFVDDILRARPHFAVSANMPRRSGTLQLNHLVASLYARGVPIRTERLYERRRPNRVDLDRELPPARARTPLAVGFPELKLSPSLLEELASLDRAPASDDLGAVVSATSSGVVPIQPIVADDGVMLAEDTSKLRDEAQNGVLAFASEASSIDAAMLDHFQTMDLFLNTQLEVMRAFNGRDAVPFNVAESSTDQVGWEEAVTALPWVGQIQSLKPGESVVTWRWLVLEGDPVGEHHTLGGKHISSLDPNRKGLPVVPFTVMAEMLAQAASLMMPGLTLSALRDVQVRKWIRYETQPVALEIRARLVPDRDHEVEVMITNWGTEPNHSENSGEQVVVGRAAFAASRPPGPAPFPITIESNRPCRFDAGDVYKDQWLFHGPAFQAISSLGPASPQGIVGDLQVLPKRGILRDGDAENLLTDPIVLDAFTQLLGCWGMDQLEEGHVIFPLRVSEITFFGEDPPEGETVHCQIAIREMSRHLVRVDSDLVARDGRVWMRIEGWEDWRFYWPTRCRDHFRKPDRLLFGEPLELVPSREVESSLTRAVWVEPPADFGRPIWGDVLEWVQIGPEERSAAEVGEPYGTLESQRLWERIAGKESAILLFKRENEDLSIYPADVEVVPSGSAGCYEAHWLASPFLADRPRIALSSTDLAAVAVATLVPEARPGVAIVAFEGESVEPFSPAAEPEHTIRFEPTPENLARWKCACLAASQSLGLSEMETAWECSSFDPESGVVQLLLARGYSDSRSSSQPAAIPVTTSQRGNFIWGWTLG